MKQEKHLILAMALALGSPATGQILTDAPELIGLLESIYRQSNPLYCVTALDYQHGRGAQVVGQSGFPCDFSPAPLSAYQAVEAHAAAAGLRAGFYWYVWELAGPSEFLVPFVSDALPLCCLVAYRTTENQGVLAGSGSTAIGGSFQLHASRAQSLAAQSTAFFSLASASLWLPALGGMVMIEPTSVLATLVLAPPVAGTASATMPVPNQPSLIGLDLYAQAVHFDPGVAFEPFRLTNGLIVTIT